MRWLALLVVSACGFAPAPVTIGMHGDDGMPGSEPPTTPCYGTGLGVRVCPAVAPTQPYDVLATTHIVTDLGSPDCIALTGPTANAYCVVAGTTIDVNGFLDARGTRPLILLSMSTLDVLGTIDVASHRSSSPQPTGPGADDAGCGGTQASQSTAAGFGGTLGSKGGNGGTDMVHDGWADPATGATTLHGGCVGG